MIDGSINNRSDDNTTVSLSERTAPQSEFLLSATKVDKQNMYMLETKEKTISP